MIKMNKKTARLLCKWQHYEELVLLAPYILLEKIINKKEWQTRIQKRGIVDWEFLVLGTIFSFVVVPMVWVLLIIGFILVGIFSVKDIISKQLGIQFDRFFTYLEKVIHPPTVYCPTKYPEKYDDTPKE